MQSSETYFEQIPVEIVKKIAKPESTTVETGSDSIRDEVEKPSPVRSDRHSDAPCGKDL